MTTTEELKEQIEELEEQIKTFEDGDNEEEFNDCIDEIYEPIDILGMKYSTSRALKELDEIAYNCAQSEWNDGKITELNDELDTLKEELKELENEEGIDKDGFEVRA